MRINKFLAQVTGMSRRAADAVVATGEVAINSQPATTGQLVTPTDVVSYRHQRYTLPDASDQPRTTLILHKPRGFVVSRNGQGSKTVYELLPIKYHSLKPIGRLDKDSSGLLLLTNDGELAHELTHPSRRKVKRYEVALNLPLQPLHRQMISEFGIQLEDGLSKLLLDRLDSPLEVAKNSNQHAQQDVDWLITMHEGRNRQIRRTFAALGYEVTRLHRIQFGDYFLENLASGAYKEI